MAPLGSSERDGSSISDAPAVSVRTGCETVRLEIVVMQDRRLGRAANFRAPLAVGTTRLSVFPFSTFFFVTDIAIYTELARIPGFTRVFIHPTPESCSNIHTQTQKHTLLPQYLFIPIYYQINSHKPIHIYNIYIRFLHIHTAICVPSLVEIAPVVSELCPNIRTHVLKNCLLRKLLLF
jgi:hypothetical protein